MGSEITLTGAAAAAPFSGGRFDLRGVWIPNTGSSTTPDTDLFVATTPDGELRLSFDAALDRFRAFVRGVNVLNTAQGTSFETTFQNWLANDQIEWRFWYYPDRTTTGGYGLRIAVNGCGGRDTVGIPSGAALNPATSLTIQGRVESWGALTHGSLTDELSDETATTPACWGVLIGDSIVAPRLTDPAIGTLILDDRARRKGLRIYSQAIGGARLATGNGNQTGRWDSGPNTGKARSKWTYIQCGVNDIAADATGDQVIDWLRALTGKIRRANPFSEILLGTILPARSYSGMGAARWAQASAVNAAILARRIDCTAVVDNSSMGDVNGSLLAEWDSSDHLHTNLAGRRENARLIRVVLRQRGLYAA